MKVELTKKQIDEIAGRVLELIDARKETGSLPPQMTTADVAALKGCSPHTVRRNWKAWNLRKLGNGPHGVAQFEGESVQEHLNRIN